MIFCCPSHRCAQPLFRKTSILQRHDETRDLAVNEETFELSYCEDFGRFFEFPEVSHFHLRRAIRLRAAASCLHLFERSAPRALFGLAALCVPLSTESVVLRRRYSAVRSQAAKGTGIEAICLASRGQWAEVMLTSNVRVPASSKSKTELPRLC